MPSGRPDRLRLATWNVEWFNALFDDAGRPWRDGQRAGRHGVTRAQQLDAIAVAMRALDADGVMVIEAPDTRGPRQTVRALERFAAEAGLRTGRALIGFPSETDQEIAFLYDAGRLAVRHDPQATGTVPRFDGAFHYDLDTDAAPEVIRFPKPPLELAVTAGDRVLRLIGVHAKSKAPYGARNRDEAMRIGIANRRKQLAQCLWLRARAVAHLAAGDDLIVMGDLNDGPGLDEFERLFGHSGVEVVLGAGAEPPLRLHDPHAAMALAQKVGVAPTTARFFLRDAGGGRFFEALLDFIMVSPGLAARAPVWRIWHPLNDPAISRVPDLHQALMTASDHFPVTLDIPI
ncbi:MAG: endonuclease/exonuclease/phosphatase family protein [Gemmobacter sp.]